jgi:hypothetical protein
LLFYSINHSLFIRTRTRNTPFEKRASPQAAQAAQAGNREAKQAAQATRRENRQRWLRMATKGVKRRQKKSAVEAVGPPLAWGAYYKGLAAQQEFNRQSIRSIRIDIIHFFLPHLE